MSGLVTMQTNDILMVPGLEIFILKTLVLKISRQQIISEKNDPACK